LPIEKARKRFQGKGKGPVAATIVDVAKLAGVSVATASRVLSGSRYKVSERVRERVLKAAAELHYVPNAHARALVGSGSKTVGVLVHDVTNPYFTQVLGAIQRVAAEMNRLVLIGSSDRDPERDLSFIHMLYAHRVEALIIAASGIDDLSFAQRMTRSLELFTRSGRRVVFINRHHVPGDCVLPDNFGGARALGQLLVKLGHRRIGIITGPERLTATRDRFDGLRHALEEAGIPLPPERVEPGEFSRDGGYRAAQRLLDRVPDLTAIAALNDLMAVGAIAALRERGIAVPRDVSVTGFGDLFFAREIMPPLTTVHIPLEEMGVRAMKLALSPAGPQIRVEHIPLEVVERESTAPPPAAARGA